MDGDVAWRHFIRWWCGVVVVPHSTPLNSVPTTSSIVLCFVLSSLSLRFSLSFDPAPGCRTPLKMWILLLLSHRHHHFLIPFIGGYDHRHPSIVNTVSHHYQVNRVSIGSCQNKRLDYFFWTSLPPYCVFLGWNESNLDHTTPCLVFWSTVDLLLTLTIFYFYFIVVGAVVSRLPSIPWIREAKRKRECHRI